MTEDQTTVAHAQACGETDARAGRAMNLKWWYQPESLSAAYRDGYQSVKSPPKQKPPAAPKRSPRVWRADRG